MFARIVRTTITGTLLAMLFFSLFIGVAFSILGFNLDGFEGLISGFLEGIVYYIKPITFFVAPMATLISAGVGLLHALRTKTLDIPNQPMLKKRIIQSAHWLATGSLFIGISGVIIGLESVRDTEKKVTHNATWNYGNIYRCNEVGIFLQTKECSSLKPSVCSSEVAEYLDSLNSETVPLTYTLSYTFGSIYSYRLTHVGVVELAPLEWQRGYEGNQDREYSYPCIYPVKQPFYARP